MQKVCVCGEGEGGRSEVCLENERMDGRLELDTPEKWFHKARVDLRGSENTASASLLLQ